MTAMNRIFTLVVSCLSLFSTTTSAQTPKENLEKGVETYNALRVYTRALTPATISNENVKEVKNRIEQGTSLLDKVVSGGTLDQSRVARYYKNSFQVELAYIYGVKGEHQISYDTYKSLENTLTAYKITDFPLIYEYANKTVRFSWDNFTSFKAEFFTGIGEACYNLGKYDESLTVLKSAMTNKNMPFWLRYTNSLKIMDIRAKNKTLMLDEEYQEWALKSMTAFIELSNDDKKRITDTKMPTWDRGYKVFNSLIDERVNTPSLGMKIGEAAKILRGVNENEKAAKFFTYALKNGWGTAILLKNEVLPTARVVNDKVLGLKVLDILETRISATDCGSLEAFVKDYTQFGELAKAEETKKKIESCQIKREQETKRKNEERKKAEELLAIERKKAARESHYFIGLHVVPLFSKPADIGGVFNYGTKRMLYELSFLKVNRNKENYYDLKLKGVTGVPEHRWDGFMSHLAFKFSGKGSTRKMKPYSGFLLGYNQRNFESFTSNVTSTVDKKTVSKVFTPSTTQYVGMVNAGLLTFHDWAVDIYGGAGVAFNQFKGGNTEVWRNANFTIEDKMVANRKPNYFNFLVRFGVAVGFGR
jgi:tetratricopeptide (TPR) repeat protein